MQKALRGSACALHLRLLSAYTNLCFCCITLASEVLLARQNYISAARFGYFLRRGLQRSGLSEGPRALHTDVQMGISGSKSLFVLKPRPYPTGTKRKLKEAVAPTRIAAAKLNAVIWAECLRLVLSVRATRERRTFASFAFGHCCALLHCCYMLI